MTTLNSGWLPMDYAPKDGTNVLMSVDGECRIARWIDGLRPYWWIEGIRMISAMRERVPDGWQPLPEPLKEGEKP